MDGGDDFFCSTLPSSPSLAPAELPAAAAALADARVAVAVRVRATHCVRYYATLRAARASVCFLDK